MNTSHPLVNPAPRDVAREEEVHEESVEVAYISREQLRLPVEREESLIQSYFKQIKATLKRRLDHIEVAQFWKNPAVPFMSVSFSANILILLFGGIIVFGKLPPELQLFYNPIEETWIPEDKIIHLIFIPFLLVTLFLLQYRFVRIIFRSDRRLSLTISWVMTVINVFLLIAISQIYTLNRG